ncbi:MAG TPA: gamma-glutamyltransferase [Terracidiphilus sp.]|nr:gamma-glutamyltransferase [Terracidiphilus sp.]
MMEGKEITVGRGAVATEAPEAARIGARILERGGNAMDAAAAACLALGVVMPYYVDVGGYACSGVVLEGASGKVWSLDSNSTAPAAAHERMYEVMAKIPGKVGLNENEYECSVKDDANIYGPLAAAPPGFMGGVGMLWEKWGRLKWPEIVEPSIALVQNGFLYHDNAMEIERRLPVIRRYEATFRMVMPEGKLPNPGDIWPRPGLDITFARLASAGWRDYYEGELGRHIGDYIESIGGVMTRADMAAFQPRVTEPLASSFRGAPVYGPILPNGSLSAIQILNMLDCIDPLPIEDVRYWHRMAEILKLGWRDRLRYLADPDFVDVPAALLLSRDYAAGRVEILRNFPDYVDRLGPLQPAANPHGTANVSAADSEGNLVAVTLTQGNPFGTCVTVPGTGFTISHGMCRFDPRPGLPNSIAPRKRPLNNLCSILLRLPDRDIALGMQGGRRMISVIPQVAQRMVDFGMSPQAAAVSPRIHTMGFEPIECEIFPPFPFLEELRNAGHEVRPVEEVGRTVHAAELFHASKQIRAGGSTFAAGV